jgi:hypothetical protein
MQLNDVGTNFLGGCVQFELLYNDFEVFKLIITCIIKEYFLSQKKINYFNFRTKKPKMKTTKF